GALGQRRQPQLDRVEAVEQVLAERTLADQRGQVGIGRADDAYLDLALAVAAEALEAAGLEHPQQLHLPGQRQRADLVQEQGAAVGRLELAFARALRAGVGTGLGPEQLGLDQVGRDRAAVERDERAVLHRRVRMHDLGDLLLAGAVRAGDQHRQLRARDLHRQRQQALAGGVGEDEAAQVVVALQRAAPAALALLHARKLAPRLR